MIGVLANPSQHTAVREFFELFKTPWEFCRGDGPRQYEVVLCTGGSAVPNAPVKLIVVYGGQALPWDAAKQVQVSPRHPGPRILLAEAIRLPIYRDSVTFAAPHTPLLQEEGSLQPAAYVIRPMNGSAVVRIGYDLFDEITALLSDGQPLANASVPTLELHIALLRNVIVSSGVPLLEIPPVPDGYRFIACLTHDVDHPSIRQHKFDHTMFGFLYRAIIGSLVAALRGRTCLRALLTNWAAALKLPFVYLGLAKDFWNQLNAYSRLDGGGSSSFFVIPFKDRPGRAGGNPAPALRASGYGASDIAPEILQLLSAGNEIGLHGIDAWHDTVKAGEEVEQIRRVTGVQEVGVRMHWLYFDQRSPAVLEQVGADYDSTVGYNETIGYRAGTAQVYKLLPAKNLLELPLHIMDTALFLRLRLSAVEARKLVAPIIDHAVRFGGVVTVNWHDRSIAPERLWRDFYVTLVNEFKSSGAWLASARQTVRWFRQRRAVTFADPDANGHAQLVSPPIAAGPDLPGLQVCLHNVSESHPPGEHDCHAEVPVDGQHHFPHGPALLLDHRQALGRDRR